jgi:hypothetical protein
MEILLFKMVQALNINSDGLKIDSPLNDSDIENTAFLIKDLDFTELMNEERSNIVAISKGPPPPPPPMMASGSTPIISKNDTKKMTKLHWKEAFTMTNTKDDSIWNDIVKTDVDKEKLSYLFESKHSELKTKVSRMSISSEMGQGQQDHYIYHSESAVYDLIYLILIRFCRSPNFLFE